MFRCAASTVPAAMPYRASCRASLRYHPWMASPEKVAAEHLAASYDAGATTRQLAAVHGVDESTIRRWLRDAGAVMRRRGERPALDPESIRGQVEDGEPLASIAASLGVSEGAVKYAALRIEPRTTRMPPGPRRSLRRAEARRLRAAWRRMPRNRALQVDWSVSAERDELARVVADLHSQGVTVAEMSREVAGTPGRLRDGLAKAGQLPNPRPVVRGVG